LDQDCQFHQASKPESDSNPEIKAWGEFVLSLFSSIRLSCPLDRRLGENQIDLVQFQLLIKGNHTYLLMFWLAMVSIISSIISFSSPSADLYGARFIASVGRYESR
jgi:hypothetical protein